MSKRTAFLPIEVSLAKISVVTTNSEKLAEVIAEAIRRTEQYSRRKDKGGFAQDFKVYECEDCRECPIHSQCTKAKSNQKRQILVNNSWHYFKVECKKKLLEEK